MNDLFSKEKMKKRIFGTNKDSKQSIENFGGKIVHDLFVFLNHDLEFG